jgi:hypothetical protein
MSRRHNHCEIHAAEKSLCARTRRVVFDDANQLLNSLYPTSSGPSTAPSQSSKSPSRVCKLPYHLQPKLSCGRWTSGSGIVMTFSPGLAGSPHFARGQGCHIARSPGVVANRPHHYPWFIALFLRSNLGFPNDSTGRVK